MATHTDPAASPCPSCKGTRQTYSFRTVGRQRVAVRKCESRSCRWKYELDCTWGVPLTLTTVEQIRAWWIAVYG